MQQGYCKVYFSLLALSYLEVVLWSSCLVVSLVCAKPVGTADTQGYLIRETVNLKCVGGQDTSEYWESWVDELSDQFVDQDFEADKQRQQLKTPELFVEESSGLSLTNLPAATKGLPAPYTGIKALL